MDLLVVGAAARRALAASHVLEEQEEPATPSLAEPLGRWVAGSGPTVQIASRAPGPSAQEQAAAEAVLLARAVVSAASVASMAAEAVAVAVRKQRPRLQEREGTAETAS